MRILALTLTLILIPAMALSATLTCDSQPGVDRYEFQNLGSITESQALPGGVMRVSLDSIPPGAYVIKARACQGVWCSDWSEEYPFEKPLLGPARNTRIEK